ncbi:CRIB domain-containing protein RIC3 [Cardamine amara subsp. amara]|uniref:CRIB domain-containing protein RIC3 n=1 Tax=Cardamine amara subsp. amara TaxID=228776 RepID=A0ABD0Z264_CARAN
MTTTVKGLLKGLRYITQIFDEDKDQDMQIGFPTDVKHVAHIGSDGPAANMPSWMGDFKPQENENGSVVSRGDANNNQTGEGVVGLQELLPSSEKPKHKKTRRKTETGSQNGSPPRRNSSVTSSDLQPRPSRRHHRSRHGSLDSSNDVSIRRRHVVSVTDTEGSDGSCTTKKSTTRHRKLKGSGGGDISMRKTKGKTENPIVQSVDKCNDDISDKD